MGCHVIAFLLFYKTPIMARNSSILFNMSLGNHIKAMLGFSFLFLSGFELYAQPAPEDVPVELISVQRVRFRLPNTDPTIPSTYRIRPGLRIKMSYLAPELPIKGVSKKYSDFAIYDSDMTTVHAKLSQGLDFFLDYQPDVNNPNLAIITLDMPCYSLPDSLENMQVVGSLSLLSDKQTAIDTTESVPLMIGEVLQAGPFTYRIHGLRKPDFTNDPLEITLVPDKNTRMHREDILHINFFDQTGKTIRTTSKGSISINDYVKEIYSLNINPGRIVAEIVYIKNLEYFSMPVALRLDGTLSPTLRP